MVTTYFVRYFLAKSSHQEEHISKEIKYFSSNAYRYRAQATAALPKVRLFTPDTLWARRSL